MKMSVQIVLILIVIGLLAGSFSGLVGIGGGVIIIPMLIYFLGFSQASGTGNQFGHHVAANWTYGSISVL